MPKWSKRANTKQAQEAHEHNTNRSRVHTTHSGGKNVPQGVSEAFELDRHNRRVERLARTLASAMIRRHAPRHPVLTRKRQLMQKRCVRTGGEGRVGGAHKWGRWERREGGLEEGRRIPPPYEDPFALRGGGPFPRRAKRHYRFLRRRKEDFCPLCVER